MTHLRFSLLSTLGLGMFNATNWCGGMCRPGCTGHGIPMLISFAIPLCAGVVSNEAAWFNAFVMTIPAGLTAWGHGVQNGLVSHGIWYSVSLAFVIAGRGIRTVLCRCGNGVNRLSDRRC